jgi:glyceraldehyde 3-phosphate dehydrogenase
LVDLTVETARPVTAESANEALRKAAAGPLKGVLDYSDLELVSVDFMGNPHSSIVDGPLTRALGDRLLKVFSWYDNEWGFSCRLKDLIPILVKG